MRTDRANQLAERLYLEIKAEIFDFRLLPGDRFTETEIARRYNVSRTPVRDALYRLKRDGYLEIAFRSGWSVVALDFRRFDELYDFRILIETKAIETLCRSETAPDLSALEAIWLADPVAVPPDPGQMAAHDEYFHATIVELAGNREMALAHAQLTEKIRIIRRLDFLKPDRVDAFYKEHVQILRMLMRRQETEAQMFLRAHVTQSMQEARKITLHMLYEAREAVLRGEVFQAERAVAGGGALVAAVAD